ncbi:MAG: hypothetical protein EA398_02270 [Deltaproteobacteria bacterium]|nr:MAG: hypothetical protein EA398_02270 [Deltaproteobacteria bacterium]
MVMPMKVACRVPKCVCVLAMLLLTACSSGDTSTEVTTEPDASSVADDVSSESEQSSEPDVVGPTSSVFNDCGGEGVLQFDGRASRAGERCGFEGSGVLICNGLDALRCVGEAVLNECGSPGVLPVEVGSRCGECGDGAWICAPDGDLRCVGAAATNICGGCMSLGAVPGESCLDELGQDGRVACDGREDTLCLVGRNACGGTDDLRHDGRRAGPGGTCALTCGLGVLVCAGGGQALECIPDGFGQPPNACGGCGTLAGVPGEACGFCGDGTWACDESGAAVCVGATTPNPCGGCSPLDGVPGGPCPGGRLFCDDGALGCQPVEPGEERNACGGRTPLDRAPGTACGVCGLGVNFCISANAVACSVPDSLQENACGGCGPLRGIPGGRCGECLTGTSVCALDGSALTCEGDLGPDALNACGRCGELDHDPGEECGTCLAWTCNEASALRCEPTDALPGCGDVVTCATLDCAELGRVCLVDDDDRASCGPCVESAIEWREQCFDRLAVTPDPVELELGGTEALAAFAALADGDPVDATADVEWSTEDPAVATVDEAGVVTAHGPGQTLVRARLDVLEVEVEVVVSGVIDLPVIALSVDPGSGAVAVGGALELTAVATFEDDSTRDVTTEAEWSTSSASTATVEAGVVTGRGDGVTVITASFGGRTATSVVTVTAPVAVGLRLEPTVLALDAGNAASVRAFALFDDGQE